MTTGQPIRYPSDRNKYNNEFNESLQLQIDLNQRNLEANRLYKETGQLPASTQMQDTRSNEEKLADIEGLKRSIISDLAPVAEPAFANAVIQGVLNSPLNVDNSLFRYLAQNAATFAQSLGRKYKFGIAGDANDVEVMVQFLEDAYNKTKNSFQSIKGYIDSNTNQGIRSKSNTLSANDTDNLKAELKDAQKRIAFLFDHFERLYGQFIPNIQASIGQFITNLNTIERFIPTSSQLTVIINNISEQIHQGIPPPNDLPQLVFKILSDLPRLSSLQTLIDTFEKGIKTRNVRKIIESINKFHQLFASFSSDTNINILQRFHDYYIDMADVEINTARNVNRINTIDEIRQMNLHQREQAHAQRVYVINPADDPAKFIPYDIHGNYINVDDRDDYSDAGSVHSGVSSLTGPSSLSGPVSSAYSRDVHSIATPDFIPALAPDALAGAPGGGARMRGPAFTQQEQAYIDDLDRTIAMYQNDPNEFANRIAETDNNHPNVTPAFKRVQKDLRAQRGVIGLGLKKGRGISTKYKPFGEHEINHKNLEKGIFTMRRKTKSNIMGLPSKHVSKHFQNIIHNIMGGKIADFTDIHNLSDDEKNYLHKIISKSNLQDRLSVPAPSKDQQEKDFHNFEVMKGEILAGNDSKELIKNFKVLTMKLTRQNLLPKNEVMDLFQDLVSLGY